MSRASRDAARQVPSAIARRFWPARPRPDGRRLLTRRAAVRAAAPFLRPTLALALAAALLIMLADESRPMLALVAIIALAALLLEVLSRPPQTRRAPRIVRNLHPPQRQDAIMPAAEKRAGRILRARPEIVLSALPPRRPRTRMSERRPGPSVNEDE